MNYHYKTLGLKEDASQEEIKIAYDKLSKELNPSNNDNQEFFEEEYKKVQEAYKALSNSSILATEKGSKSHKSQDLDLTGKPTKESAWDGSINGIPAPQGTYIWKFYGKFSDVTIWLNEEGENTGPIYLIR